MKKYNGNKLIDHFAKLTQDLLCNLDSDGSCKFLNSNWEELLGYDRTELLSKPINGLIHKDDRTEYDRLISNIRKVEKPVGFSNRIVSKDGSIYQINWSASADGNDIYLVGRNITERDIIEEELSQHKIIASNYLNIIGNIIIALDHKGEITLLNKKGHEILGYKQDELIGKDWFSTCLPGGISKEIKEYFLELISGNVEGQESNENEVIRKDGQKRIIKWYNTLVKNDSGDITGLLSSGEDITEKKLKEKEIEETKQFYEGIIEGVQDGIWVSDKDDIIYFANKAMSNIAGIPVEKIVGKNVLVDFSDETISEFSTYYKRVKDEKIPLWYDAKVVTPLGKETYQNGWLIPRLKDNNYDGIICTIRDITERKKNEFELIDSENRLSTIFNSSNDYQALFECKSNNNFILVAVNEPYIQKAIQYGLDMDRERILGISIKEIAANVLLLNEEQQDQLVSNYVKVYETNKKLEFIEDMKIGDNDYYAEISLIPILDSQGSCQYVLYNSHDISEIKHAELEQSITNARHSAMIENIGDVIAIVDETGTSKYQSSNVEKWFGWKPDELVGKDGWDKMHPDDIEKIQLEFVKVLSKETPSTVEYRFLCKDGNYKWIELTAVNRINDPAIEGVLLNYRDISANKEAELQLIESKDKAEESDRLKSSFLANMSHEIRTPMNGILGFTSLLKEPGLSGEKQNKFIGIIEKSGARMLSTIHDIIDISKIESGQVQISTTEINLNLHMQEMFDFFSPEANKNNVQLYFTDRLPEKIEIVRSDIEKLSSILTNLIKNAIKHTHSGRIDFGCNIKEKESKKIMEFYVIDTGSGIPSNRLDAIFDRFVQADIEDTQAYEGSGLGLSICKAYVEMLGGEIWVESEEGVGSKFSFTLPYIPGGKDEEDIIIEESDSNSIENIKLKILIVDDDEYVITYLGIVLEDFMREILIAKTGVEAVEICKNNSDIDLVLMDIKIPEIDGYMATRKIREFNKDVFILAQTAYAQYGDRIKCLESGCNDYIPKPIDKERLHEIISKNFQ